MTSLFNKRELSDIDLILVDLETGEEKIIYVHKAILANRSPYFLTLFTSEFKEIKSSSIKLKVQNIDMASKLIEWMYTRNPIIPEDSNELAKQWLIIEPKKYPGIEGEFEFSYEKEFRGENKSIIVYNSIIPNSLIKQIVFISYTDKIYRLQIKLGEIYEGKYGNYKQVSEYLENFNIIRKIDFTSFVHAGTDSNSREMKTLLDIIFENNKFKEQDLIKIEKFFDNRFISFPQ